MPGAVAVVGNGFMPSISKEAFLAAHRMATQLEVQPLSTRGMELPLWLLHQVHCKAVVCFQSGRQMERITRRRWRQLHMQEWSIIFLPSTSIHSKDSAMSPLHSFFIPHSSFLIPHSSFLVPFSSFFFPLSLLLFYSEVYRYPGKTPLQGLRPYASLFPHSAVCSESRTKLGSRSSARDDKLLLVLWPVMSSP